MPGKRETDHEVQQRDRAWSPIVRTTMGRRSLSLKCPDIADYPGLTIDTVSRQLTRVKAAEIISMIDTRAFEVPDIASLAKVARSIHTAGGKPEAASD
ncbi:helix-turn-helix domain-containing protein [Nordella sp. HKS 07]|uniref:helix-turn-helix domain-containing protein n=1 Tax=Nordella sp. HKS 07 TaxID=2712222 RepID=UPI0013E1C997|nr:helix-turn-helix domain-containing protein [Nordella sp. HKS 07]QIG48389.1 helix-turn-helix domain-containing protein [Nordella sp. HKS 07]